MSTAYREGLRALANKEIDWDTDDIRAQMISPDYTPDFDAHDDMADIVAGDRYGSGPDAAVLIPSRTIVEVTAGIVELRGGAVTFPSVALHEAQDVVSIVIFLWASGVEANQTLLALDTLVADVTPDGNNIVWTPSATGIIKLDG